MSQLITSAIAIADKVTQKLKLPVIVQHHAWIGEDDTYGAPEYAPAVERLAIVEYRNKSRQLETGVDIFEKASITILRPIEPNGADQRREPVDVRDQFVLPDGYTGPVLDVQGGLVSPETDTLYMVEVILG